MSFNITLESSDQHNFQAYLAKPSTSPKGCVVIVQEIFGVTQHIQQVTDRFASEGYLALSPCLFDRVGSDIKLNYDSSGVSKGRNLKDQVDEYSELDIQAAIEHLQSSGPVAVVGFCWGGSLAWRVATDPNNNNLASAVSYYGGELPALANRSLICPFMAHFGIHDGSIPEKDARAFAAYQPKVGTYFYDAGHGFNCNDRDQYNEFAARTAWGRTIDFLADCFV